MERIHVASALALFASSLLCGMTIDRVPLPAATGPETVIAHGEGWQSLWRDHSKGIGVDLSARSDASGLHILVTVEDPSHDNDYSGRFLWRGDCLYISFDGRGDSPDQASVTDADDGIVLLGLGADGGEATVHSHGDAQKTGPLPDEDYRIWRDEAHRLTHYELLLTWDLLGSAPGISTHMGLAAVVAHKNLDGEDLRWGEVFSRNGQNRHLNLLCLTDPDTSVAFARGRERLSLPDTVSRVRFMVDQSLGTTIRVEVRDMTGLLIISAEFADGGSDSVRGELTVSLADVVRHGNRLWMRVLKNDHEILDTELEFTTLTHRAGLLIQKIDQALQGNLTNPVELLHLRSLRSLTLQLLVDAPFHVDLVWQDKALDTLERFSQQFGPSGFDFRAHLANGLPLLLAFISTHDGSLQFATLQLPPEWQPEQAYPFVVYLHGSGPRSPLDTLNTAVDNRNQDTLWRHGTGVDAEEGQRQCILLAPYGRGSQGYLGAAEEDVWQAMEVLEATVRIDPDRRYITGFSMGCSGAWYLAHRRPDLWAGVNLAAGFGDFSTTSSPAYQQGRELPIALWCGELDPFIVGARAFAESLEGTSDHIFRSVPDLPHTYPYREYGKMLAWLFQFSRRPGIHEFNYRSDHNRYLGRNGVWMHAPFSYVNRTVYDFGVSITGNEVTVETKNAVGLSIEPRECGFETGDCLSIVWNGEVVFSGQWDGTQRLSFGENDVLSMFRPQLGAGLR